MDEQGKARIGMALSGGGFRATLFHLGVVRLLYETGYLGAAKHPETGRRGAVKRIGAVSGGSVIAAHLALNWKRYTGVVEEFDAAAKELIAFVQKDIRGRITRRWILAWVWLIPRLLARSKRWTLANLLQRYYDDLFKHTSLETLRRPAPEVFFNCTSLTTGSACYFGPAGFTRFTGEGEKAVRSDEVLVSFAVAASSAFPPLFPPIEISHDTLVCSREEFDQPHYLTDGGVYDNLGINPRIWRNGAETADFDALIVSDAEGFFDAQFDEEYTSLVSRNVRASDLLMTRVSELQLESVVAQSAPFVRVGIKQVLDQKINPEGEYDHVISVDKQRALSKIRTDLDAFSSHEVTALIAHGFSVARHALISHGFLTKDTPRFTWDPLGNLSELAKRSEKLTIKLRKGSKRKWRAFSIYDPGTLLAAVATAALVGVGTFKGIREYEAYVQAAATEATKRATDPWVLKVGELNATVEGLRSQLAAAKRETYNKPQFTTTSLQVCQGEYQSSCPPGTIFLDCGKSVSAFVDSQCKTSTITRISTRGGNRCGYSIDQVLCTNQVKQPEHAIER